jgi:urease accessory protein UreF
MYIYIHIYCLLNKAAGSYAVSNEMMCKEATVDYFDVLSSHLTGKTRESCKNAVRVVCYRL